MIRIRRVFFCVAFLCAMLTSNFAEAGTLAIEPEPSSTAAKQAPDGRIVIPMMPGVGYFDSFARAKGIPANVARRPVDYFYALEDAEGRLIPVEDYPHMAELYNAVYFRPETLPNSGASRALLREAGKRSPRQTADVLASIGVQIKHDDVVATVPSMPKSAVVSKPDVQTETPTLTNENLAEPLALKPAPQDTITNKDIPKVAPQVMEPALPSDGIRTEFVDVGGSLFVELFERERCRIILRGATEEFSAQYWPHDGRYIEYNNDKDFTGGILLTAVADNTSTEVAQTLRLYPSNIVGDADHAEVTVTVKAVIPAVSQELTETVNQVVSDTRPIVLEWGKTTKVTLHPGQHYKVLAPKGAVDGMSVASHSSLIGYEYVDDYKAMWVWVSRTTEPKVMRIYNYGDASFRSAGLEINTPARRQK